MYLFIYFGVFDKYVNQHDDTSKEESNICYGRKAAA
jgi:hypothetical protein